MIIYKFGNIDCKISFKDFLSITIEDTPFTIKKFKSDFKEFSELYELIEINKKKITNILFDGYEYILQNGLFHNLYGAALIRHNDGDDTYFKGTSRWYYIDGKLVHIDPFDIRGCRKIEDFEKGNIYFYENITGKQSGRDENTGRMYRIIEGVDFKKYPIDLQFRRKLDQRKKKLQKLNDY
jgi:hypothetical protein